MGALVKMNSISMRCDVFPFLHPRKKKNEQRKQQETAKTERYFICSLFMQHLRLLPLIFSWVLGSRGKQLSEFQSLMNFKVIIHVFVLALRNLKQLESGTDFIVV